MATYETPRRRGVPENALYDDKNPIPYGTQLRYDQGYDAQVRERGPRGRPPRAEDHDASGHFYSSSLGATIELWISDVTADFSLSGQTGQSRMVREFFPRSFNDVTLTITGNVSSTQEYNRLAAFVRESHWQSLRKINDGLKTDQTIAFELYDNTPTHWRTAKAHVKKAHLPWKVSGYIKKMAAGATAHEVAPQFQVEFIVTDSQLAANTGIWSDIAQGPRALSSFKDLLTIAERADRATGTGFISNPTPSPKAPAPAPRQATAEEVMAATVWTQGAWMKTLHR